MQIFRVDKKARSVIWLRVYLLYCDTRKLLPDNLLPIMSKFPKTFVNKQTFYKRVNSISRANLCCMSGLNGANVMVPSQVSILYFNFNLCYLWIMY